MTDRPKEGQRRIRSGVVAQAVVPAASRYSFVEEWREGCRCPDCTVDGHWTRIGDNLGYATWVEASMFADPPKFTMSGGPGLNQIFTRLSKLEAGAGITAAEAS